jgi:membrane-bound serine protease (ClpP class)
MVAAQARPVRIFWGRFHASLAAYLLVVGAVLFPRPAFAQPAGGDGLFLTVPNPITQDAVNLIKTKVAYAFERQHRTIKTLVFDFNPNGSAATQDYGPCLTLKNYVADLWQRRVKLGEGYPQLNTVAFVHAKTTRHTVLPVLACAELVMAKEASLGNVLTPGSVERLPEEVELAYRKIAEKSRWGDLVLRMLDKDLVIRKVRTKEGGIAFWSQATLDKKKVAGERVQVEPTPAGLEPGTSLFPAEVAFRLELAKEVLPATRAGVRDALGLPMASIREEWLPEQALAYRIDVNGSIDAGRLQSLKRRINAALKGGANVLILKLYCAGGQTVDVASAARFLKNLNSDNGPVITIAYVPPGVSLGAGTFLALGCSQIVMADTAVLGDFDELKDASEEELRPKRDMLVELAEQQGYSPLLFKATLERGLTLYRARTRTGVWQIVTEAQVKEDEGRPQGQRRWSLTSRIPQAPDEFLKIDATLAKECDVAVWADVDSLDDLYQRYDLHRVEVSRDDWLDRVAEFFREPIVNVFLILIGIGGLILELKMPGLGFPGVLAALCFVLFFWAHSFVGQFTMLAVLLFVLGLVLIGLEVFVVPGSAVMGVSGVVLLVGSLVLVTLDHMPQTSKDWMELGVTLTTFVLSMLGAVIGAFTLAWYLPHIPYAKRLMLPAPTEEEGELGETAPLPTPPAALLGAIGEAATPLRPAGKARFGEDFLDVISEGDYITPGSRVQVVELEGNRIVVKAV